MFKEFQLKNLLGVLIVLICTNLSAEGDESCEPTFKREGCNLAHSCIAPFYVSDTYLQGLRMYENFRNLDDDRVVERYIPKGSIVYTPPELMELEATNDYRVPVEVLSVDNSDLAESLRVSRYWGRLNQDNPNEARRWIGKGEFTSMVDGIRNLQRVEAQERGFLDRRSLKPAGNYTFFVSEDIQMYRTPKGNLLNGMKLRLKTAIHEGREKYLINRCCMINERDPEELLCHNFYRFDVINQENQVVEVMINHNLECTVFPHLRAIPKEDEDAFQNILNMLDSAASVPNLPGLQELEIIPRMSDYLGPDESANTELLKFPINENDQGPFNSFHYSPDDKGDSDVFVNPTTACAYMQILEEFSKRCTAPGCMSQFGNMYHTQSWQVHSTHGSGYCIDMRFFRKSDDANTGGLYVNGARYDREKNKMFIDLLVKAGAENIYINDNSLISDYTSGNRNTTLLDGSSENIEQFMQNRNFPESYPGHDNHLHFCLNPEKDIINQTCQNGL